MFLAFQYPMEIPGVSIANFLRAAVQARLREGEELEATEYYARLYEKMDLLEIDRKFTSRSVNEGFSGGEKKRNEILQMAMLEPRYAILDETDSGLDIDALRIVSNGVNTLRGPDMGILLITHYQRLLDYIVPDHRARDGRGPHRAAPAARNSRSNLRKRVTIGSSKKKNWRNRPRFESRPHIMHTYANRHTTSTSTAASAISSYPEQP